VRHGGVVIVDVPGQRDSGHAMSSLTNAFPAGKAIMDLITGRVKLDA
jgi:hypothetical protein